VAASAFAPEVPSAEVLARVSVWVSALAPAPLHAPPAA